ncbi:MAG: autotransporter assembly complex protein TamA [Acidobacteriota bacterium]|nr:autotransporter assembly complex protein TamA [Acidobacteriota bacterium]
MIAASSSPKPRPWRWPLILLPLLLWLAGATAVTAAEKLKVEIDGLRGELRSNVVLSLEIEEDRKEKDLTEERIRHLHTLAPGQIAEALQPFGYYRPSIEASLKRDNDTWTARYTVDPGPQLKVTHRDLSLSGPGADDPGFRGLTAAFPLHEGDGLLEVRYEAGKKAFDDYAAENGYLDAGFRVNQIRIDLATYTADIVLHYDTGPSYRLGPVTFHQSFLDPKLLQGYVKWKEGDTLRASRLLALQEALSDSPYFQRVEVVPRRDLAQGDLVPIDVNLVPSKPQRWTAGLGYGTDTGPRVSAGLELRHLNRQGHRANVQSRVSLIERSFQSQYVIPGAYPRTDLLTFSAGYAFLQTTTSTTRSSLLGATQTRQLGRWQQALSLDFQRATYTVGVDSGISRLLTPQATWSRVWADDRVYPSHGEKIDFAIRGADRSVLSNATFLQVSGDGKFIQSFADRRFRLITRAQVGYTATHDFRLLPPTVRFFAGGDQSVRGYAYQGLGERDQKGNVIGGPAVVAASAELDYMFFRKWGAAVFYDAGNAGPSLAVPVKSGAGVGVRWLSPLGLVRADVAFALSIPGNPIRFHLTLGPDL